MPRSPLDRRLVALERVAPKVCALCGRCPGDGRPQWGVLFRYEGKIVTSRGVDVSEAECVRCEQCGRSAVPYDKVIVGVDPVAMCGGL